MHAKFLKSEGDENRQQDGLGLGMGRFKSRERPLYLSNEEEAAR